MTSSTCHHFVLPTAPFASLGEVKYLLNFVAFNFDSPPEHCDQHSPFKQWQIYAPIVVFLISETPLHTTCAIKEESWSYSKVMTLQGIMRKLTLQLWSPTVKISYLILIHGLLECKPHSRTSFVSKNVLKLTCRTQELSSTQFVAFRMISCIKSLQHASTWSPSYTQRMLVTVWTCLSGHSRCYRMYPVTGDE